MLIVDDASPDGTSDVAARLVQTYPDRIFLTVRHDARGRGSAVEHGFRRAMERGYEWCLEMDADFSHDPADIPRFIAARDDADVVVGSRNIAGGGVVGWHWRRHLLHRLASGYARWLVGPTTTDQTNGFRLYRVDALRAVPLVSPSAGYVGQTLRAFFLHRAGKRIRDVPVIFHERRAGQSKMSAREAFHGAWMLLRYRLQWGTKVRKPLR